MPGYTARWHRLCRRTRATLVDPVCWYCNHPIDLGLDAKHPLSHTFDHIIPRIQGGDDVLSNMANAHRSCNTKRRNDMEKNGWTITTSIDW